jgi:predicted choloylglycine hydrolase
LAERYGKGNVDRVGRLWVLRLKGTSFERGLQHGTLMRYRIRDTITFYRTLPERLASRTVPYGSYRYRAVIRLKRTLVDRFTRNRDCDALEEMRGLAVGLGMKPEELAEAFVMADVFQSIAALAERHRKAGPPAPLGFGCTSVVRQTYDDMLFARNFDFWGAGYWDSNPAIIFHVPDKGKAFCSIATAGLPTGGVTAINEDGLAIGVHQHGSLDSSLKGTPVMDIAHRILRSSSTVEDALEVASGFRATGGWTIVIAGGNQPGAAALEMSSAIQKPRWITDDLLVATNSFRDEELASRELQSDTGATICDQARHLRATRMASQPGIDDARMAAILGDHYDVLAGRERSAGNTISRITTLSSVLFSLGKRHFWVSESPAPTSKGAFVGFDLDRELEDGRSSVGRLESGRPPKIKTTSAQDMYLEAYKEYVGSNDLNRVLMILGECASIDREEPTFPFMEGITRAMVGNYRGALSSVTRSEELEPVEAKKPVHKLWMARILDLLDRREESLPLYNELAEGENLSTLTTRAARSGIKKAYREKDLGRLMLDFSNSDTIE